jgi:hypothetical protein
MESIQKINTDLKEKMQQYQNIAIKASEVTNEIESLKYHLKDSNDKHDKQ